MKDPVWGSLSRLTAHALKYLYLKLFRKSQIAHTEHGF